MKPSCDVYIPETAPPVLPELGFGAELLGEQAASKWKSKTVKWTDENMEGQDLPIPLKIVVTLVISASQTQNISKDQRYAKRIEAIRHNGPCAMA